MLGNYCKTSRPAEAQRPRGTVTEFRFNLLVTDTMRHLISVGLFFAIVPVAGQTLGLSNKVQVFRTSDGRLHSRRFYDSVRNKSSQFVVLSNLKDGNDSTYYLLSYFSKSELVDRYQKDGSFCGSSSRKKLEEIKKLDPFNKVAKIKMVSFKQIKSKDGERASRGIPATNGKVDFQKMYEVKTLDKDLSNKLLDILVNYDNGENGMEVAFCYDPRNGIVFLDKSGNVLGYIEICFDCQRYQITFKTSAITSFCNEKLDVIQGIFMKTGITYGMMKDIAE